MKIELDTEKIKAILDMWRGSTDLQVPMMDHFKILLMKNRHEILGNLLQAATAWNQMLSCMTPLEEEAAFATLRQDTQQFIAWASSEIDKLDQMKHE